MNSSESNYPFVNTNEEFIKLIDSFLSKQKWTSNKIGVKSTFYDARYYLLLVDYKAYVINEEFKVKAYRLYDNLIQNNIFSFGSIQSIYSTYDHSPYGDRDFFKPSLLLNGMDEKKIDEYKKELGEYESSYLKWINHKKDKLLKSNEVKSLLVSFLDIYLKDFYKDIESPYYFEDNLLLPIFCRKQKLNHPVQYRQKQSIDKKLQKIIDLLYKREDLLKNKMMEEEYCPFLIINRALKEISLNYYSDIFEDSYENYFPFVEEMKLKDCIHSYFDIDFIDQADDENINLLTYYLFKRTSFLQKASQQSILRAKKLVKERVVSFNEDKELYYFEQKLIGNKLITNKEIDIVSIDEVDLMNGFEFEDFISSLFKTMGYTINSTPKSGDQGIDVIVIKNGLKIGIQTKRYASGVSNKAIQEVVSGIRHYGLEKAIVITNNFFTKSAIELGISNDVILWDRNILKEKMKNVKKN